MSDGPLAPPSKRLPCGATTPTNELCYACLRKNCVGPDAYWLQKGGAERVHRCFERKMA